MREVTLEPLAEKCLETLEGASGHGGKVEEKEGILDGKVYGAWRHFSSQIFTPGVLTVPHATCYITVPSFSPSGAGVILTSQTGPQEWVKAGGMTFPRSHSWG